jgi:hypothetical protein
VTFLIFALVVPGEAEVMDPAGGLDNVGAFLGVSVLVLFNFVWKYVAIPLLASCCSPIFAYL